MNPVRLLLVALVMLGVPTLAATATAADPGDDPVLVAAAKVNQMPVETLERILTTDRTAHLDAKNRLYYTDFAERTITAGTAANRIFPYDATFALHSRPGAARVIYIDFDGHDTTNTQWPQKGFQPGLNADGVAGFSAAEHDIIQNVWMRVAEDYAPYDVDVTTADPGMDRLARAGTADTLFGMRALVTSNMLDCGSGCLGKAYVGVFDSAPATPGYLMPAWTSATAARNDAIQIAETVSHEVGHTLGLSHDGKTTGLLSPRIEYYDGPGIWDPIMGAGFGALTQFSKGEYAGATNRQDDFAVMAANGAPFRPDDHTFTPMTSLAHGVIESAADQDWFVVNQRCSGPFSVVANTVPLGPNLDIRLGVLNAQGGLIGAADPASAQGADMFTAIGLSAGLTLNLPAGNYIIVVDGIGSGDPRGAGYSDYGSVGMYSVSASVSCPPSPPSAARIRKAYSGAYGGRTTATSRWAAPLSAGGGPITGYHVVALRLNAAGRVVQRITSEVGPAARALKWYLPRGRYRFKVAARNDAGLGPLSAASNIVRSR